MAFTSGMTAFRRIAPLAALGSLAVALTGCTLGTIATSNGGSPIAAHVSGLGGKIMGGEQPIAGATVALYTVGTTGYGTGAAAISGATTTTDMYGNFSIPSFTCPVSNSVGSNGSDPLTYLVATGGNPGLGLGATVTGETVTGSAGAYTDTFTGANNFYVGESVVFSGFTTFSYLNGTQTITAVNGNQGGNSTFSIADASASNPGTGTFTDSGLVSGKSSTNSAIRLVATTGPCSQSTTVNLDLDEVTTAAMAYALAQYTNPATGQIGAPNTLQAQTGLINAVSVLPLLVNSAGQPVTSTNLPGASVTITATPEATKLATVANILAACVNSAGNTGSTSACGTLFSNAGAGTASDTFDAAVEMVQLPFNTNAQVASLYSLQTAQSPFGGTSTAPTDWTLGIQYTSATALNFPVDLAADSSGNIWVMNNGSSAGGGIAEITPGGTPGFYANAFGSGSTSIAALNPRNIAIDTANNIYVTTSGSPYDEVRLPANSTAGTQATVVAFTSPLNKSPYGLAIDGNNNVFMGLQSSSANVELVEFPNNSGTSTLSLSNYITYPIASATAGTAGTAGTNSYIVPEYMAFDTAGNLWMTGGSGTNPGAAVELKNINTTSCTTFPCTLTTSTTANTYVTSSGGGQSGPWGVAANSGAIMWDANISNASVTAIAGASGASGTTPGTATGYAPTGGFNAPHYLATDGAGNVWVANKNTGAAPLGGTVSEISATGTLLSPVPVAPSIAPVGYIHVGLNSGEGIAVDPSGNVWIANDASGGGVEELVGSAAPAVTPISLALKNSAVASKP